MSKWLSAGKAGREKVFVGRSDQLKSYFLTQSSVFRILALVIRMNKSERRIGCSA
jgi:hypothetical protein